MSFTAIDCQQGPTIVLTDGNGELRIFLGVDEKGNAPSLGPLDEQKGAGSNSLRSGTAGRICTQTISDS